MGEKKFHWLDLPFGRPGSHQRRQSARRLLLAAQTFRARSGRRTTLTPRDHAHSASHEPHLRKQGRLVFWTSTRILDRRTPCQRSTDRKREHFNKISCRGLTIHSCHLCPTWSAINQHTTAHGDGALGIFDVLNVSEKSSWQ